MRRAIQRLIQDPLALKLLNGEFLEGDTIEVDADPGDERASLPEARPGGGVTHVPIVGQTWQTIVFCGLPCMRQ